MRIVADVDEKMARIALEMCSETSQKNLSPDELLAGIAWLVNYPA